MGASFQLQSCWQHLFYQSCFHSQLKVQVHSENYHVCLLITTRTNQSGEYTGIYGHKQPSPSGGLWTINPCLLWFIYVLHTFIFSIDIVY